VEEIMRRENLMARMLRALSGRTQEQTAAALGVHPSLIAQIELDEVAAGPGHLQTMARLADLTVAGAEELLAHYDALRRSSRWRGEPSLEGFLQRMNDGMRGHLTAAYEELLALPLDGGPREETDPEELWARMEKHTEAMQIVLIEDGEEFQSWPLHHKLLELAGEEEARDPERAASLKRLARRIAELAPDLGQVDPEEFERPA
jgi:transcriptional regulator with XRE-family HTH domain